jgi:hypothetical protein
LLLLDYCSGLWPDLTLALCSERQEWHS